MKISSFTRIATIVLGLLYLTSGVFKAFGVNDFADVIVGYGIPKLRMIAPLIIGLEIALGISFLLDVYRRKAGLLSLILLMVFTVIFAVGYIWLGIEDCGCFGDVITMTPVTSLIRNISMMILSYVIWRQPESMVRLVTFKSVIAAGMGIMVFVLTGFEMKKTYVEISVHEGSRLGDAFLKGIVDSTKDQFVFVFSPSCLHCQKATSTVNLYKETKTINNVVGLYPNTVSEAVVRQYQRELSPNFRIVAVDVKLLKSITRTLPTALLLHRGFVQKIYLKEIPGPHNLVATNDSPLNERLTVFSPAQSANSQLRE